MAVTGETAEPDVIERSRELELAKVEVDAEPELAARFGIRVRTGSRSKLRQRLG